jgi:haloalkane dehalogenase
VKQREDKMPRRRFGRERRTAVRGRTAVLDASVAYLEQGSGAPVVFIHGGIGTAHLWRGIMPHVATSARAIAFDLVGRGDSTAPLGGGPTGWTRHVEYLDHFLRAVAAIDDVTIVMHGWGSIIGLEWARSNESRLAGLVNVESVMRPMAWHELDPWLTAAIRRARSSDGVLSLPASRELVAEALQAQTSRPVASSLLAEYQRALGTPSTRASLAAELAALPVGGRPAESVAMVRSCREFLMTTNVPKLLVLGRPGWLLRKRARDLAVKIPGQTVAAVDGAHLLPAEAPDQIGVFLSLWLQGNLVPST